MVKAKAKSNRVVKIGKWEYTEQELEQMHAEAIKRGEERMKTEPSAETARYDPEAKRLVIELLNGCVFICPTDLLQGLRGASAEELADFKLMPRGFDLHWKKLDAQFTVEGLLKGEFGTRAWMAELERERRAAAEPKAKRVNSKKSKRTGTQASGVQRRRKVA